MASSTDRLIGSAKLDIATYEEVEADAGATSQAMVVVLISSVAGGIGTLDLGVTGLTGGPVDGAAALVASRDGRELQDIQRRFQNLDTCAIKTILVGAAVVDCITNSSGA